ncbi:MAG: inorganic pyrophosphatase [Parachlamydiales bacterium]
MTREEERHLLTQLYRAHPWHGVSIGEGQPELVNAYVEIVPTDTVKYELDKETGILKIDRPQKFSNVCPALYGFIPQTLCMERVGDYCKEKLQRLDIVGDGDPLDICIFAERPISRGDLLIRAIPIGGFRMLDGDEADDKIIAVLEKDLVYGKIREVAECPVSLINRLRHYFLTYKAVPSSVPGGPGKELRVEIAAVYGREEAHEVIRLALADYRAHYKAVYEARARDHGGE